MKPRRVMVLLELDTDEPLGHLSNKQWWADILNVPLMEVKQAQADVVRGKA